MNSLTYILGFIFLISISSFFSCSSENPESIDPILVECWTHSHEESSGNEPAIFRPCDFKTFPFSRYRSRFTLRDDGTCDYLVLAPDDGHFVVEGSWSLNAVRDSLIIVDEDSQVLLEKMIVEVKEDKLILQ